MANISRTTTAGRVFNDLRNLARRQGRGTEELLVLYVLERWLYRAAQSPYRERLILKGGLLLAVLDARRPTRDADLLAEFDRDEAAVTARVREISSINVDDGVSFDIDQTATTPGLVWPVRVVRTAPVVASQMRTVWSSLAVASQVPSGLIATPSSELVWPVRVVRTAPVVASQMRTVWSSLALASQVPSGLIATPHHPAGVRWPDDGPPGWPCRLPRDARRGPSLRGGRQGTPAPWPRCASLPAERGHE